MAKNFVSYWLLIDVTDLYSLMPSMSNNIDAFDYSSII